MAENRGMYREIKSALVKQIRGYLKVLEEEVDVYSVPYQNISVFPAVAIEIESRRKPKVGVGVKQLELDFVIWVYVDIYDAEDAEEECLRVTELVENAIESDKTLSGAVQYLDLDDQADFGIVEQGEATFLQGAKIRLRVRKRFT